jgi:predicted nucleotidyltransferase
MYLSNPLSTLFPGAHGHVLRQLLIESRPQSGRAIAVKLGQSVGKSRVIEVLSDLAHLGVVDREIVGSSHLFSINKDHLCYQTLKVLASPMPSLIKQIQRIVAGFQRAPLAVVIFGSVAKGSSQAGSDLDLLVLRPNHVSPEDSAWESQTLELVVQLERSTGYPVQLVEYSESEFQALVNRGARLVTELSDTAVAVTGELQLARREAS